MTMVLFIALLVLVFAVGRQSKRLESLENAQALLWAELARMRLEHGSTSAATETERYGAQERSAPDVAFAEPGLRVPSAAGSAQDASGESSLEPFGPHVPADAPSAPPQPASWARPAPRSLAPVRLAPSLGMDFLATLGSRWTVWVGGLALALGGIFLVRYTLETGLLGPRTRLALAALFGLGLVLAAEWTRRAGFDRGPRAAHIPAALASAGAFVLFGTVYAAHGIYGFIGAAPAFLLLGAVALASVAASLVLGRALAGLGLLGANVAPALVASQSANIPVLFAYLAVVLAAAVAVARFSRWSLLSAAAFAGFALWSVAYLFEAPDPAVLPVALAQLAALAILSAVWLARPQASADGEDGAVIVAAISASLVSFLFVLLLADGPAAVLLAAMVLIGVAQAGALALFAGAAVTAALLVAANVLPAAMFAIDRELSAALVPLLPFADPDRFLWVGPAVTALIVVCGVPLAVRRAVWRPRESLLFAVAATALAPFALVSLWIRFGDLSVDLRFAALGLALAALFAFAADRAARRGTGDGWRPWTVPVFAAGAALLLALSISMALHWFGATLALALAALVPAAAARHRPWPVLGWLAVAFATLVAGRIAIDPTVIGASNLSTTPILNALLPAYLVPAFSFAAASRLLPDRTDRRPRLVLEALASLFALVGLAMLVRHSMNGGVIAAGEPELAEQAVYTLILIGAGWVLLALDGRAPSPVFRFGSMLAGALSLGSAALAHLGALNPLSTGAALGANPVFDLLFLAYLLPALALALSAWRASGRRPHAYVMMLAAGSGVMAFAYVSLAIRRLFHGDIVIDTLGIGPVENWTYSAAWLLLGVVALLAGLRLRSRTLQAASAVLVTVTVAKVFLFDMRHLDGLLRPLSFIGLGAVLIGIGLGYQRMLRQPEAEHRAPMARA